MCVGEVLAKRDASSWLAAIARGGGVVRGLCVLPAAGMGARRRLYFVRLDDAALPWTDMRSAREGRRGGKGRSEHGLCD